MNGRINAEKILWLLLLFVVFFCFKSEFCNGRVVFSVVFWYWSSSCCCCCSISNRSFSSSNQIRFTLKIDQCFFLSFWQLFYCCCCFSHSILCLAVFSQKQKKNSIETIDTIDDDESIHEKKDIVRILFQFFGYDTHWIDTYPHTHMHRCVIVPGTNKKKSKKINFGSKPKKNKTKKNDQSIGSSSLSSVNWLTREMSSRFNQNRFFCKKIKKSLHSLYPAVYLVSEMMMMMKKIEPEKNFSPNKKINKTKNFRQRKKTNQTDKLLLLMWLVEKWWQKKFMKVHECQTLNRKLGKKISFIHDWYRIQCENQFTWQTWKSCQLLKMEKKTTTATENEIEWLVNKSQ